ncbi:MAG: glycosyltransferase family 4 protein [Thermodesulfobacteriota bacterium]|nr:glycosyltransferase family 4 protein [Thermodesulfobacteriota bacterium]
MKILLINKFLYRKGGDAISTLATGKLLSAKGHDVVFWGMHHPENPPYPFQGQFVSTINYDDVGGIASMFKAALNILYSFEASRKMATLLQYVKPDVVHLNNFAHQISPSILNVFARHNIPMVMSMHDYKMVCPTYSMLLDGEPCERCKRGKYYLCLVKKCTKGSYAKSLVNAMEMYLHHKILQSYDKIKLFISPSMFLKEKVEEMGFKGKILHLPNFLELHEFSPCYKAKENSIVYAGRFSPEKGVETLLDAVKCLDVKVKLVGDGPLESRLKFKVKSEKLDSVDFLGYMNHEQLKEEVRKSIGLIIPSELYENNPRVVIEAFAMGKPVIGARIGGIPELVKDGKTGYTFEAGNVLDLKNKIEWLLNDLDKVEEMGKNSRRFAEEECDAKKHYKKLLEIYEEILQ